MDEEPESSDIAINIIASGDLDRLYCLPTRHGSQKMGARYLISLRPFTNIYIYNRHGRKYVFRQDKPLKRREWLNVFYFGPSVL